MSPNARDLASKLSQVPKGEGARHCGIRAGGALRFIFKLFRDRAGTSLADRKPARSHHLPDLTEGQRFRVNSITTQL